MFHVGESALVARAAALSLSLWLWEGGAGADSWTASEMEQKMTPALSKSSRNVVAIESATGTEVMSPWRCSSPKLRA